MSTAELRDINLSARKGHKVIYQGANAKAFGHVCIVDRRESSERFVILKFKDQEIRMTDDCFMLLTKEIG